MTTKKKAFDAIVESRRWKRASGRRLAKMTFAEQQEHLRRVTEAFFSKKPSRRALAAVKL